jgi:hypothetical protein
MLITRKRLLIRDHLLDNLKIKSDNLDLHRINAVTNQKQNQIFLRNLQTNKSQKYKLLNIRR